MTEALPKAFAGAILAFMVFIMFFTIPLLPGLFIYCDSGDGQWIDELSADESQYASGGGYVIPDGEFLWPVPGVSRYTSGFGIRYHPVKNKWRMHYGIDIGTSAGADIVAAEDGIVSYTGIKGDYGKTVIINHDEGMQSLYAHNLKLLVKEGDRVERGDIIAKAGSTGVSTGPHLHFEIRIDNTRIDPLPYIVSDK